MALRLNLVSHYHPTLIRDWSGTPYWMMRALDDLCAQVFPVGGGEDKERPSLARRIVHRLGRRLVGKGLRLQGLDSKRLRLMGQRIGEQLNGEADAVLSVTPYPIGHVQTTLPLYMYGDATIENLFDYYYPTSELLPWEMARIRNYERRTLHRCRHLFYSSEWAARSAIDDFGISPERVSAVGVGYNLPEVEDFPKQFGSGRVLFVAAAHKRKRLSLACRAMALVHRHLPRVRLDVVGRQPPPEVLQQPFVTWHGWLDKSKPDDLQRLLSLYRSADLFLLPTQADCTPVVVVEAAYLKTPVLVCDTGGTPELLIDGVTGCLMPVTSNAQDIAERVVALLSQPDLLRDMGEAGRQWVRKERSWPVVCRRVVETIALDLGVDLP